MRAEGWVALGLYFTEDQDPNSETPGHRSGNRRKVWLGFIRFPSWHRSTCRPDSSGERTRPLSGDDPHSSQGREQHAREAPAEPWTARSTPGRARHLPLAEFCPLSFPRHLTDKSRKRPFREPNGGLWTLLHGTLPLPCNCFSHSCKGSLPDWETPRV